MLNLYTIYALAATKVIPSAIGLYRYRRFTAPLKFITVLLVIGMLNETVMIILSMQKINNLFTIHFYALMEIIFFSLFFYHQIQSPVVRKIIKLAIVSLSAFAIIYAIAGSNIAEFNSIPRAIECAYFSFLGYWLFYEMANDARTVDNAEYFINGAIIFYFSSCFLIFAFSKYLASDKNLVMMMLSTHSVINAFCNLVYATGLWRASKRYYTPA